MEYVADPNEAVKYGKCIVKDKDLLSDDFIGSQQFELPNTYINNWDTRVLELQNEEGRPQGVLTIQIKFVTGQQYASQAGNTERRQEKEAAYDERIEKQLNRNKCCDCIIL